MFGAKRLLVEIGIIRCECVGKLHGTDGLKDFRVRIEGKLPIVRRVVSELLEIVRCGGANASPSVCIRIELIGARLKGGEPPFFVQFARQVCRFDAISAADAAVDAHPVAGVPTEEHVDWQSRRLPADVPQRVIYGGNHGEPGTTGWETELLVQFHHDILNAPRVFALNHFKYVIGDGLNGELWSGGICFTPAG